MIATSAQAQDFIELNAPVKTGGMPVMEAFNTRQSTRVFADRPLDPQTLSEILWSAWGENNHGTRTIPTAHNKQDLIVYALMENGAWLYNAQKNGLENVTKEDLRPILAQQDYVMSAPLSLVFAGSTDHYATLQAGASTQNVGLYAASKGLAAVVRGLFDREKLNEALKLQSGKDTLITMTIGNKQ